LRLELEDVQDLNNCIKCACLSVCLFERVCERVWDVCEVEVWTFLFLCLKAALEELYGHTTPSPSLPCPHMTRLAVSMRQG
jgi:hypothetical protein